MTENHGGKLEVPDDRTDALSEVAPSVRSVDTALSSDDVPPPAYGDIYGHVEGGQEGLGTNAQIAGKFTHFTCKFNTS